MTELAEDFFCKNLWRKSGFCQGSHVWPRQIVLLRFYVFILYAKAHSMYIPMPSFFLFPFLPSRDVSAPASEVLLRPPKGSHDPREFIIHFELGNGKGGTAEQRALGEALHIWTSHSLHEYPSAGTAVLSLQACREDCGEWRAQLAPFFVALNSRGRETCYQ